ncbi:LCP family protein [Bifidobacterium breve]|jgi:LCP family protein required for cell wall assembly|nr:LCP family protein [Bifidobacterium breve]MBU9890007.1 LCP family protein [Bifidobacterium breve]MBV3239621.1 LCP family protein [Bifidobacterium breve]MBV3253467.1 LCP family protein [Bifidobacterium breve]MBV3255310.1 LCP family protein [Bifidobacterium breve]MBV3257149.1 LCP family protein [Bifidobacterium breve]
MTQESGGADPQINPPSFIPSAGRRSRASPQTPRTITPSSSSRTPRAAGGNDNGIPPSFSPNVNRSARRSTSASSQPQSIPPTQARRSSGSSRNASTPASSVIRSATPSRTPVVAMTSGHNSAIAIRDRGHKVRNGVIGAVILLIAALVLAVFGAWGWVDGKLNKADWLTTAADTPASTWLILGSDERDGSTNFGGVDDISGYRTDTILVLTKPKSGPSSLISIPRDSLMNVDDQYMKINAVAQLVGKKALVGEIEQLTGQKIDHVAQVKFGGLQKVVDALGGVELCYDQDVQDAYSGLNWTAGCHNADGSTALSFSRMRYADATGDFGRNARQRQVISAIVKKASSKETLTNPKTVTTMAEAGLSALTVDGKTTPLTLVNMALAFKDATGSKGISGSVYWSNPDYYMDGVGSSVLLDDAKNTELFSQLAAGTHAAGTVGTLAES